MNSYEAKEFSYFDQMRSEVLDWMPDKVERVFEIGCGSGATLSHIKSIGRADWVGGLELIGTVVELGKQNIDLLLQGNIENDNIPLDDASIDVILCLDVLEHLIDPWSAVTKLKKFLKPGGIIIVSLPNVRNLKVVMPLIFRDEWKYVGSGQLDRTHLRFFTSKSALELFTNAGLKVILTPVYFRQKSNAGLVNKLTFGVFSKFLQGNIFVVARKAS